MEGLNVKSPCNVSLIYGGKRGQESFKLIFFLL